MSSTGSLLFGSQGSERRESIRSIGLLQGECALYEVEPSSATLCPTGTPRRRGKSVEPRFPHNNTLNPSGRSPSRDRSPGPGGIRRSSYAPNSGDGDLRIATLRKKSFIVVPNDPVGGQERKYSCPGQVPIVVQGQERKLSYFGQVPGLLQGQERKQSRVGSSDGQKPSPVSDLQSELNTIRQNCQFLGDLLSTVKPGKEQDSDKELLREFNVTCLENKKRVVQLLESSEGQKLSDELLNLNDELNVVLFKYQKYSRSTASTDSDNLAASGGSSMVTQQPVTVTVEDSELNHLIDFNTSNGSSRTGRF